MHIIRLNLNFKKRMRTSVRVCADASVHPRRSCGRSATSVLICGRPRGHERVSVQSRGRRAVSVLTRGCGRASVRTLSQARLRLYNPHLRVHYLLFLLCLLVGDLGSANTTPNLTCKREGITSNLRGIPLHFCQAKIQELYLP